MLLFLNESPVFAYEPDIYGTVSDGRLLGLVGDAGGIRLPAVGDDEESRLLAGASTLARLREAANGPQRTVRLDSSGQVIGSEE